MKMVIFYITFILMDVMYLHARTYFTLIDTTSIPMGAMYLYMQELFLHSLIPLLFPWVQCMCTCV